MRNAARSWVAALVVAMSMSLLAAPRARTQSTEPAVGTQSDDARVTELLNGRWRLASGEAAAQREVDRAIERATTGMLPIVRGFAQRELRERNPVNGDFTISISPTRIRTEFAAATFDGAPGRPISTRVPGESDALEVVQLLRGGRLEQVFTTEQGRRWNVFVPSEDGEHVSMQVVVHASILPRDLRYQLAYDRAR